MIAEEYGSLAKHFEASNWSGRFKTFPGEQNSAPERRLAIELTEAEREWLSAQRARSCKHGHLRHDARVYRNPSGSLWLDCAQCVRNRVNAYRQRMARLIAQAR